MIDNEIKAWTGVFKGQTETAYMRILAKDAKTARKVALEYFNGVEGALLGIGRDPTLDSHYTATEKRSFENEVIHCTWLIY